MGNENNSIYRNVFNPTEHVTIATKTHLDEWQEEAKTIFEDIKALGIVKTEERIVYVCNHVYNLGLPDNKMFSNMYQVIGKI